MELQPEHHDALQVIAKYYGRNWKSELRACWMHGAYPHHLDGETKALLQQVRNRIGPSGLSKYTLQDNSEG